VNTFEFPLTQLVLPTEANPDGRNQFEVLIDTTNGGWAVEVAWAELRLKEDFAPLALIHGFTSTGEVMGDFRDFMINSQAVQTDEVITPTHTSTNLESGVEEIATPIDNLQLATGGYHVNMIAHSYGGLVARLYAWDNPSRVNKLILIGTPNGGSELADAACLAINAGPFASPILVGQVFDDQFSMQRARRCAVPAPD
jgi:triacylglycerol esterase/lipase EstA (alpha/beta hydrolase family)